MSFQAYVDNIKAKTGKAVNFLFGIRINLKTLK